MITNEFNGVGRGTRGFDNPFLLYSSESMPVDLQTAMDLCLFLYYLTPAYRTASTRVIRHFVTDFDYPTEGSKEEKTDLDDFLQYTLQLPSFLQDMGDDWACFAGETTVVTRDGVFPIKDLVGRRVDVLSKGGTYRPADFKSYGQQILMEVEFSDGRKIYATPEHEWEVLNCSNKEVRISTTKLRNGHRIARTVAPRPERNEDYREGVRHGFIFGDGSQVSKNTTEAMFCGAKYPALQPYFEGEGNPAYQRTDRKDTWRSSGQPGHFKELPAADASASYWYGFVCGFLAADGTVDTYGCAMLTQCSLGVLQAIETQLPRIGMVAGPIRDQQRVTHISGNNYDSTIYFMTLLKRFMTKEDFILPHHQTNFVENCDPDSNYGKYVSIRAVRETERFEEVYCCTEMETHTIVVGNGVLSGQCYGNAFAYIYLPFDRFLIDPRNSREYALDIFGSDARYNHSDLTYNVPDPSAAGSRVTLAFRDRPSTDASRVRLRLLNPRWVTIRHNMISGSSRFVYRFENFLLEDVKKGRLHIVNELPRAMLQAISKTQDFLFDAGSVFHLRAPTVSGVSNYGWGMPGTIANYRNIHQMQVYRKIDEAVGLDYMVPFRVICPAPQQGNMDPFKNILGPTWTAEMRQMIDNRRRDKFAIHSVPFPVQYQEFGANGKILTPKDLLEFQTGSLLDGMGYPQELFKGTLQFMQVPTGLRLFENSFKFLQVGFNLFTQWATKRIRSYLGMPPMRVVLQRPSMADSIERKQMIFQLAATGEISRETAYDMLGIDDVIGEMRKRMEEDAKLQKLKLQMDAQLQQELQAGTIGMQDGSSPGGGGAGAPAGAPAQGGQPAGPGGGGGGGGGQTPMDVQDDASSLAQYWLSIPTSGERAKAIASVRSTNEQLAALAQKRMEQMRDQGASQGRQMVAQQAQQGVNPNAGGPAPPQ